MTAITGFDWGIIAASIFLTVAVSVGTWWVLRQDGKERAGWPVTDVLREWADGPECWLPNEEHEFDVLDGVETCIGCGTIK